MQMALLRALNVGRFTNCADHIAEFDALANRHTNIITQVGIITDNAVCMFYGDGAAPKVVCFNGGDRSG